MLLVTFALIEKVVGRVRLLGKDTFVQVQASLVQCAVSGLAPVSLFNQVLWDLQGVELATIVC